MFTPKPICVIALMVVLQLLSGARAAGQAGGAHSTPAKIAAEVKLSDDGVHPGTVCRAMVIVTVQDGWHINAAGASDNNLLSTAVDVEKVQGLDSIVLRYPPGVERRFEFADTPLDVYEGSVNIIVELRLASTLEPGTYEVPAVIRYQACSEKMCLAPASIRIRIPVHVVAAGKKIEREAE